MLFLSAILLANVSQTPEVSAQPAGGLQPGFVRLRSVDATIVQDIRYATSYNFIGRPVKGYLAPECILTEQAAAALTRAQQELAKKNLSLIVWDCYRPTQAVADFVAWGKDPRRTEMRTAFYPRIEKPQLFAGYIASRSAHSRGSTVDLGLMPIATKSVPPRDPAAPLTSCLATKAERIDEGAIDFGTAYDCLDPLSNTANSLVGGTALENRQVLKTTMEQVGFKAYSKEWWHFELRNEPFQRGFDFPVR
jgi:D-alanyl-D-alanine dipeptidase